MNLKPGDAIAYGIGWPGSDWTVGLVLEDPVGDCVKVWDCSLLAEATMCFPPDNPMGGPWPAKPEHLATGYTDGRGGQWVRRNYGDLIREARERYGL